MAFSSLGRGKILLKAGLALIFLVIVLIVLVSLYSGYSLINPERTPLDRQPSHEMDYKDIKFSSRCGEEKLRGWYFPAEESTSTVIFAHGYEQNRLQGEIGLPLTKSLLQEGYNVLLFDFRNSGESSGSITSIGQYETKDLLGAVDYISSTKDDEKIVIHGFSMGAVAAILAGSEEEKINGVIADSPFANLTSYLEDNLSYWTNLPSIPFNWTITNSIRLTTKLQPDKVSPFNEVKNYDIPLLLIHGIEDEIIPLTASEKILEAAPEKLVDLLIIPGAGHVAGYLDDEKKYTQNTIEFLEGAME